jgi:hypothetical protein
MTDIKSVTFKPQALPKKTLRLAKTLRSSHAIAFSGHSLLESANQALEQKTQDFLKNPYLQLNQKPITGMDLLKLLHQMSNSAEGKRDWGGLVWAPILVPLALFSDDFRQNIGELWRKGTPRHLFFSKLCAFQTLQGEPCDPKQIAFELMVHKLVTQSMSLHLVLTNEGLQHLKQEESKTISSQLVPILSRIETHGKTDEN